MADKKNKKGLWVFIIMVAAIIIIVAGALTVSVRNTSYNGDYVTSNEKTSIKHVKGIKQDYVAVLYIEGTISEANSTYNQKWILQTIERLKEDPRNLGIMLFLNSGGGAVYQADEVFLALQNYKTSGKKLHAYMGPMAASGAYYIPCAADRITANRNTLTGSIGVLAGTSIDLTKFFEKHGIKMTTIHAGKNKNMMNYDEPFTAEQQAIMQSVADECYEQFTNIVSSSRNIPLQELLPLCDGRVFTAKQALTHGLIDEINTWENTIEDFRCNVLGRPDLKIIHMKYEKEKSFYEKMLTGLSSIGEKEATVLDGIPKEVWEEINSIQYPAYIYRP